MGEKTRMNPLSFVGEMCRNFSLADSIIWVRGSTVIVSLGCYEAFFKIDIG